jgi:hypothetical protein
LNLRKAAHNIPEYANAMTLTDVNNVFHPKYQQMKDRKIIGIGPPKDKDDGGYSSYIHNIERTKCPLANFVK